MTKANNVKKATKEVKTGKAMVQRLTAQEYFKRAGLVKHEGPKNPSFNLSATKFNFAFLDKKRKEFGGLLSLNPKTLSRFIVTNDMNEAEIRKDVKLFIVVQGSTNVETFMLDDDSLVQRNSESMLVRDAARNVKTFTVTKKDPLNRQDLITEELMAYDNTRQLNLKVADVVEKLNKVFTSKSIKKQFGDVNPKQLDHLIKETLLNGVLVMNKQEHLKVFTLNSAAPSQTRKGEAAFWMYGQQQGFDNLNALIFNDAARSIAVYGRFSATYRMNEYGKLNLNTGKRVFKMDKEPKRLDMPASGSRSSEAFSRLFGQMVIIDQFNYRDDEGVLKGFTILESAHNMMGGVKRRLAILEDPIHMVQERAKIVKKINPETGAPEIIEGIYKFPKNLVDGGILVSHEVTEFMVAEGNLEHRGQSFQGRGVAGVKPFAYGAPQLKEITGYDMVFMSGALKLDVVPALLEGRFEFAVVQGSRREYESDMAPVATQALLATGTPQQNLELLHMIAQGRIDASMYSAAKALKILGVTDNFNEEQSEELNEDEEFASEVEGETGVKAILRKAPHAIKDGVQKERLINMMAKALEKIKLGNVLVDDAKMRHMGFDVFMVMKAIQSVSRQHKQGVEVPQMEWVASIPAGCAVVVDAFGNLRSGEFLAIRYPALKKEEVRKIMATVLFGSEEARRYYEQAAKDGFFQGLVLFNSVDMSTEAMSGADFDGDTCLVIFNMLMVEPFSNVTPLLDFFMKEDGTLEGGCPWSTPKQAVKLSDFIVAPQGLEFTQVVKNGQRTWALEFNEEDVVNRPEDVYFVFNRMAALHIAETAKLSSIGLWTNRLMNVEEIQLEIEAETARAIRLEDNEKLVALEKEAVFYDDLATWLTCIVRWAIDEAKHGGAFNEPLANIVAIFEDSHSPAEMRELLDLEAFKMTRMF